MYRKSIQKCRGTFQSSLTAGFSLVELLAVTGVIALVSGLVLVSNSTFGGKVLLQNLAYDIALSIRQAQVYGIAVHRTVSNNFNSGYGVHFDLSSPGNYILFGDSISANGLYESGEEIESTTISNGFRINQLCATTGGTETCTYTTLDVLFKRPDPEAWISATDANSTMNPCILTGVCYTSARILIRSPRGNTSSVVLDQNGQISVQ